VSKSQKEKESSEGKPWMLPDPKTLLTVRSHFTTVNCSKRQVNGTEETDEKDGREKCTPRESALSDVGSGKDAEATRRNLERW
jgi:hypothetical protein